MELLFATNNNHKLKEIREAVGSQFKILSLAEKGIIEEIPETQNTLEGNAIQKATYISEKYGCSCFADDTGLEVVALGDRPGVYSARYAGENCSFRDNVNKLLSELEGIENRRASFRTVIAYSDKGNIHSFEGIVEGSITKKYRGSDGFGYDPVFLPKDYKETFAEMPLALKNSISHRGKALEKFINFLRKTYLK